MHPFLLVLKAGAAIIGALLVLFALFSFLSWACDRSGEGGRA